MDCTASRIQNLNPHECKRKQIERDESFDKKLNRRTDFGVLNAAKLKN